MIEITGNIWDYHDAGKTICITTNYGWKLNGLNVMGKGIAAEALKRYPTLAAWYGTKCHKHWVRTGGAMIMDPVFYPMKNLIMFPTKRMRDNPALTWRFSSSIEQIKHSAGKLVGLMKDRNLDEVYLPRPGCGNGGLLWKNVRPYLLWLPDTVKIISLE